MATPSVAGELMLLGDVFMRSAYISFDRTGAPKIGFATPNCTVVPPHSAKDDIVMVFGIIGSSIVLFL